MTLHRLRIVLRVALGFVFLYAGVVKAIDPAAFQKDIDSFQLLPRALTAALALYMPWLEIACGAALVLQLASRAATLLVLIVLLVFLGAFVVSWARGLDITCGCFGATVNKTSYTWLIARDLGLIALALAGLPPDNHAASLPRKYPAAAGLDNSTRVP